jgi:nanoRNase/pAp phosphatase (c-di-AMP/oligoRNAs hydrolase)
MNRSGAALAWSYFHPQKPMLPLLKYIEDRDLWKFQLPDSEAINAYIQSQSPTLNSMTALMEKTKDGMTSLKEGGQQILETTATMVNAISRQAVKRLFEYEGELHPVYVVNSSILRSEIGNELCKREHCAAAFVYSYDMDSSKYIISVRSSTSFLGKHGTKLNRKSWLDASKVAEAHAGGGHQHAASFSFYGHIDDLFIREVKNKP